MMKNPAYYFHLYSIVAIVGFISAAIFESVSHYKIGFETQHFPRHHIEIEFDAKKHCPNIVYNNYRSHLVIHVYIDVYPIYIPYINNMQSLQLNFLVHISQQPKHYIIQCFIFYSASRRYWCCRELAGS